MYLRYYKYTEHNNVKFLLLFLPLMVSSTGQMICAQMIQEVEGGSETPSLPLHKVMWSMRKWRKHQFLQQFVKFNELILRPVNGSEAGTLVIIGI